MLYTAVIMGVYMYIKHLVRGTKKAEYYYNILNSARAKTLFLPSLSETYAKCSSAKIDAYFKCVEFAREFARNWSDSDCIMIVGDYGVIAHNCDTFTFGASLMIKSKGDDDFREFRYLIITKSNIYTLFVD